MIKLTRSFNCLHNGKYFYKKVLYTAKYLSLIILIIIQRKAHITNSVIEYFTILIRYPCIAINYVDIIRIQKLAYYLPVYKQLIIIEIYNCFQRNEKQPKKVIILKKQLTMLFSLGAHLRNICTDKPECNIPGVANTTIGPGLSTYARSKGC